ncbi:MAG: non-hydrolyzing UDP-N-acetylglucosamine 2-epimerase [Candidatus Longimicrobiales bacterium M2_2A_002]
MSQQSHEAEPAGRGEGAEGARILVVVGTRPEAIKMAPVLAALAGDRRAETRLALTGQHSDLVDPILDVFDRTPDYDLGIMREGQSLYDVAHGCLDGLRGVVTDYRPDALLVQGDTATVFYGALVGFFERTRVGHVEAGLRSGRKWAPYPEEMFRRLTDVLTDWYFAPTPRARENLLCENVPDDRVFVTGNTVVDALQIMAERAGPAESPVVAERLAEAARGTKLILMTAHRRESFGTPLRSVFEAVREVASKRDDVAFLYPVHPNPNVRGPAEELLGDLRRVHLTEPLGYLDLIRALRAATLVLTDSGGIQEEAPAFGVPVLVLRDVTERPEGVEAGVARLVGTDRRRIVTEVEATLDEDTTQGTAGTNPYGDGRAGARIADIVVSDLVGEPRRTSDWDGDAR